MVLDLTVSYNGIRLKDHVSVSDIESQIVSGDLSTFNADQMSVLVGSRVAERLMIESGDRVTLKGGTGNLKLRVAGIFETGVSQIDKNRIYIHLDKAKEFSGKRFSGSFFKLEC